MTAVPEAKSAHQPAKGIKKNSMFNIYPVLGILILLVLAALVYGGLLSFLLEQWRK